MNPQGPGEPSTFLFTQSILPNSSAPPNSALQKELTSTRSELRKVEGLLAREKSVSSQLSTRVATLVEEIQTLEQQRAASNREKVQAIEECQKWRTKYDDRARDYGEKLPRLEREKHDLEHHYQELVAKFHHTLEQQQAAEVRAEEFKLKYEANAAQLHRSDTELDACRRQLMVSVKQLTDLQTSNAQLNQRLTAAEIDVQEKARLEQVCSGQQTELDALRVNLQNLQQSSTAERKNLENQIQTFKDRIIELEKYSQELRADNELYCLALASERKEHAQRREEQAFMHEQEVKKLQAVAHSLEQEKEDLHFRLTTETTISSKVRDTLHGTHATLDQLTQQLRQFTADRDELSTELSSVRAKLHQEQALRQADNADFTFKIKDLESQKKTILAEINELSDHLKAECEKSQGLEGALQTAVDQNQQLHKDLGTVQNQFHSECFKTTQLNSQLSVLELERAEATDRHLLFVTAFGEFNVLTGQLHRATLQRGVEQKHASEAFRRKISEMEADRVQLLRTVECSGTQIEQLGSALADLRTKLAAEERRNAAEATERMRLEANWKEQETQLRRQLLERETSITNLQLACDHAQTERSQLQAQIQNLITQNSKLAPLQDEITGLQAKLADEAKNHVRDLKLRSIQEKFLEGSVETLCGKLKEQAEALKLSGERFEQFRTQSQSTLQALHKRKEEYKAALNVAKGNSRDAVAAYEAQRTRADQLKVAYDDLDAKFLTLKDMYKELASRNQVEASTGKAPVSGGPSKAVPSAQVSPLPPPGTLFSSTPATTTQGLSTQDPNTANLQVRKRTRAD